MNKNIKLLLTFITIISFSLLNINESNAHFGSKGPFGGSVSCMIVNDTTIYVGTENGGVFESTSAQVVSWRARPVGLKSGKITSLAHTGTYLFAATADSGIFRFTGFVGTDRYWEKMNTGLTQLRVKSLVAIDSITVLVGTDGDGLFKSIDKGANWTPVNSAPLNGAVITAMTRSGNRIFLTTEAGGVFISDDQGNNWADFNDGNTLGMVGTKALSYNATSDELMVLNHMGLFVAGSAMSTSTPSYTAASTGLPIVLTIHHISNDGLNWLLAGSDGIYMTATGTINWISESTGLGTLDARAVVAFQNLYVAGTRLEGMYKAPSTISAISWSAVNVNFNNLRTYSMITKDATLVVAATEKGVFVSTDLASTYTASNNGLTDSLRVNDLSFFGNTLVAATTTGGVFLSTDTGKTWTVFNTGLMMNDIRKIYTSATYTYLIDANGNLFQSDLVSNWNLIQTGLPLAAWPTSIAFYGSNMILGTLGDGVFVRAETGGTWLAINTGLTNMKVTSVTANSTNIFAGTDGSGVFTADITSLAWTATAPTTISHTSLMGLDGSKIQAMARNGGYVFASYQGGLLATSDNGTTWIQGGNQFNLPSYTNVNKISFVTTRVFVTSDHNCLYSNALSELPSLVGIFGPRVENNADALILSPNPSNGKFLIALDNEKERINEVLVTDQLGRVVERRNDLSSLTNLELSINVPSGIYFVRVNTGERFLTKMITIK